MQENIMDKLSVHKGSLCSSGGYRVPGAAFLATAARWAVRDARACILSAVFGCGEGNAGRVVCAARLSREWCRRALSISSPDSRL